MAYLSTGSEWTFELIQRYDREIARIAGEFGLDTYPNQIEIITAEQMLDAYRDVRDRLIQQVKRLLTP